MDNSNGSGDLDPNHILLTNFQTEEEISASESCDSVISRLAGREKQRTSQESAPEESNEWCSYSSLPRGLSVALSSIKQSTGHSARTITKCLSHQMVALFSASPDIQSLYADYGSVSKMAAKHGGMDDLVERIGHPVFRYVSENPVSGKFQTVGKLFGMVRSLPPSLGMDMYRLFGIGLVWSLSTTSREALSGVVARALRPELDHFQQYLWERTRLMKAYLEMAENRANRKAGYK